MKFPKVILGLGLFGASAIIAFPADTALTIANNTPKFLASATKLGPVNASTAMDVSIWLQAHNKAELDGLAKDLYNPKSPNYRHWLSKSDIDARFAPTAAEAKTVEDFFTSHNLTVTKVGPSNFYVRAHGTAAAVQSAFGVKLAEFNVKGQTVRSNLNDPQVTGPAATLVGSVYGLDSMEYSHPIVSQSSAAVKGKSEGRSNGFSSQGSAGGPTPGGPSPGGPAPASALGFVSTCFTSARTETFSADGITATYKGNGYTGSEVGCGYTPAEIQKAYNLTGLYKEGYDGTGQTVAIVDWCGSPTITHDANTFSAEFGLPKLTPANFSIIETPTPSMCAAPDPEINLDVEWVHSIAPGAGIALIVPPSASFQDVDEAVFYAVNYQIGSVLSGSYGSEELYTPPSILATEDLINEIAAISGISANFSSGDYGDFVLDDPQDNPQSVSAPADSPYATGVGGISLALTSTNTIAWQTGWGTNETTLDDSGDLIQYDPPVNEGFIFGSGGGASAFFYKPAFQSKLKGNARLIPDISWLGDPFTGAVIAISNPGVAPSLQYETYGGTSLACPMFSALWAIANQEAGSWLGQAAPYLYAMPAGTITDILPHTSSTNVTGKIKDGSGTTVYSAADLAQPLENTTKFYSALWDVPLYQDTTEVITFGTDSGLTITPGWDDVTGLGVPNAKAFADYFFVPAMP